LRQLLDNSLRRDQAIDDYELEHDIPGIGHRRLVLNARRIVTAAGTTELILLALVTIG
jgi:hypothetical protein